MLLLGRLARRALSTIKSHNDQAKDQPVLELLKRMPALDKSTIKVQVKQEHITQGTVPLMVVCKILTLYTEDPLTWNPEVLHRIFKVPLDYCDNICGYLHMLTRFATNDSERESRTIQEAFVVDVRRLMTDKLYLPEVQQLKFIEEGEPPPVVEQEEPPAKEQHRVSQAPISKQPTKIQKPA